MHLSCRGAGLVSVFGNNIKMISISKIYIYMKRNLYIFLNVLLYYFNVEDKDFITGIDSKPLLSIHPDTLAQT